jgi:5-methylcytosine-specific restriction endonuclease McrA
VAHREEDAITGAAWYAANKEYHNAWTAAYYQDRKELLAPRYAAYHQEHKEEHNAKGAAWLKVHPESNRAKSSRRRVRVKVSMTKLDRALSADYRLAIKNDMCFYCKDLPGAEDDHYISLANGGTDHWWNLVRACALCNGRKYTMNGDEFIERESHGTHVPSL